LIGTGLAVLGAGGGVAVGLLTHHEPSEVDIPDPKVLRAAVQAEQDLLAGLSGGVPDVPSDLLRALRADHQAHLTALRASVAVALGSPSPSLAPAPRSPGSNSRVRIRALEAAAAQAAAHRAAALTGPDAALLASIAACEATHAELLS
jgi:hypothetical protein